MFQDNAPYASFWYGRALDPDINDPAVRTPVREALAFLSNRYDGQLVAKGVSVAQSFVWRSECEFLDEPSLPRFCLRAHLWEVRAGCQSGRVDRLNPADELFESGSVAYRRFVNLRPHELWKLLDSSKMLSRRFCWVSDAMLVPPERYRQAEWHLAGMGAYSHLYGLAGFPCFPYAMPMESVGGRCAQACLFQATVMASRFGGKPLAPLDFTILIDGLRREKDPYVQVDGLKMLEMLAAVRSRWTGPIGAILELTSFSEKTEHTCGNGERFLKEQVLPYLDAGLPVILGVDFQRLHGNAALKWLKVPAKTPRPELRHGVTVIGYRRQGKALRFLINDSTYGPFLDIPEEVLAHAVCLSQDPPPDTDPPRPTAPRTGYCNALVCTPPELRIRLSEVAMMHIVSNDRLLLSGKLDVLGIGAPGYTDIEFELVRSCDLSATLLRLAEELLGARLAAVPSSPRPEFFGLGDVASLRGQAYCWLGVYRTDNGTREIVLWWAYGGQHPGLLAQGAFNFRAEHPKQLDTWIVPNPGHGNNPSIVYREIKIR